MQEMKEKTPVQAPAPPIFIKPPTNMGIDNLESSNMKTAMAPIFFQDQMGRNILASIETLNEK